MAEALLDAIECRAKARAGTEQQMLIFGKSPALEFKCVKRVISHNGACWIVFRRHRLAAERVLCLRVQNHVLDFVCDHACICQCLSACLHAPSLCAQAPLCWGCRSLPSYGCVHLPGCSLCFAACLCR